MQSSIAIIGMSGRFPLAGNVQEFYRNLRDGKNCVRDISLQRRKDTSLHPASYLPLGFLEDIDKFDAEFFHISPAEAECMDPNQRLLLEAAQETFENAGYNTDDISGSNTNVYVCGPEYVYHKLATRFNPMLITGNMSAMTAGMIARHFNLQGNAMLIDTTCSSSLVAVHLACRDLQSGQAEMAVVCGINIVVFPPLQNEEDSLGILAKDGKAKAFDKDADGSAGGEAVTCILLKPLEVALRDKDIIHAVIRGTAVNQDAARSSFLTAPSRTAQAEVLRKAWKDAGVSPDTITYIEAHGTGTKLGDPIEIDAINLAFAAHTTRKHFCSVASVKTNIGHTDRAAGLSGLIKVVLSLKSKQLFPSLHFNQPNPLIDFEQSAVYVNTVLKSWETPDGQARRAGVSAFGLSGTNCHAVLEEFPQQACTLPDGKLRLYCVSGKNQERLSANMRALYYYLEENENLSPADISYTVNKGRKHYQHRYAFVAGSRQEIINNLKAAADNKNEWKRLPEKTCELILVFSGDRYLRAEEIAVLCNRYPVFDTSYKKYRNLTPDKDVNNPQVMALLSHIACFDLLSHYGVFTENLLGVGIGEIAVSVIMKECTWEEAVVRTVTSPEEAMNDLPRRLEGFVMREGMRKKLLFAEAGIRGRIIETLLSSYPEQGGVVSCGLEINQPCPVLAMISTLYLHGYLPHWNMMYADESVRRIELPAYQFKKSRSWIKEEEISSGVEDWCYQMSWKPASIPVQQQTIKGEVLLLIMDEGKSGLGKALVARLETDNTIICVHLSDTFRQISRTIYQLDKTVAADYLKLEESLLRDGIVITGMITLNDYSNDPHASLSVQLDTGVYMLFHLLKAFANYLKSSNFLLVSVSSGACKVEEDDLVIPANALSSVMLKSLLSEYLTLRINSIDVAHGGNPELVASLVIQEVNADDTLRFVAYRGETRYVPVISNITIAEKEVSPIITGGTYLITGGASGIGYETAKLIAGEVPVKLIILGRTPLPGNWDVEGAGNSGKAADIVQRLNALKQLGAKVTYYAVDVADTEAMKNLSVSIWSDFEQIHGVIHAAGIPGKRSSFVRTTFDDLVSTLAAKVQGTVNLEQCCRGLNTGFFILYSSLNSIVPQKNSIDYAIANAFEDAFVIASRSSNIRYQAINWPGWYETGMSATNGEIFPVDKHFPLKPLSNNDGMKVLEYIFRLKPSNIQVADINLNLFAVNPYFQIGGREYLEASSSADKKADIPLTTEMKLAGIWKEVLKLTNVNTDDDFFDLGGHSLNATQVLNRIEKEFSVRLEIDTIFEYGTLGELTTCVEELLNAGTVISYEKIMPVPTQEYYETSHAQKRLWVLAQFKEGITAYNMPYAVELRELDKEAFTRAFEVLEARHESLRTTFRNIDGLPKQVIHPPGALKFNIAYQDLRGKDERVDIAKKIADEEADLPFDLENGPLMRAKLLQLEDNVHIFLFTIHHIISDGWSLEILLKEMTALYEAFLAGEPDPLLPLRIQYKDFVYWQLRMIGEKDERYWLNKLSDYPGLINLPYDNLNNTTSSFRGARVEVWTDADTTASLKAIALKNHTSLSNVIFSIFNILLHSISGQNDLMIGMAAANRTHLDTEHMIGFFVNTLVIRNYIHAGLDFEEVLKQVTQSVTEANDHQHYPFDLLVEKLNPQRITNRQALFNVMYTFQNYADVMIEPDAVVGSGLKTATATVSNTLFDQQVNYSHFDLTNFVCDYGNRLILGVNYNSDLFDRYTITELMNSYKEFIQLTIAGYSETINSL